MSAPALPKAEVAGSGLSEEEWLELRDTGVGGSEIAGILGHSPWDSPYTVWARKRHEMPPLQESAPMRWGKALEQAIATQWSIDSGIESWQPDPITIYRSLECPIALSSPDRLTKDLDGWVEIKNVGLWRAEEWDHGVPLPYWCQAQFQLAVSGLPVCHVAALVGGQDLRWRRVEADPEWQAMAFEVAESFWHLVKSGTPPDPDASDATRKALQERYAEKVPDAVEGGADLAIAVAAYLDGAELEKQARSAKTLAQNRIQLILAEHETGLVEGVPFVSIKTQHRSGYVVAPADFSKITVLKGAK